MANLNSSTSTELDSVYTPIDSDEDGTPYDSDIESKIRSKTRLVSDIESKIRSKTRLVSDMKILLKRFNNTTGINHYHNCNSCHRGLYNNGIQHGEQWEEPGLKCCGVHPSALCTNCTIEVGCEDEETETGEVCLGLSGFFGRTRIETQDEYSCYTNTACRKCVIKKLKCKKHKMMCFDCLPRSICDYCKVYLKEYFHRVFLSVDLNILMESCMVNMNGKYYLDMDSFVNTKGHRLEIRGEIDH
ncbi:MAG: hypothetical protein JKX76_02005 [Colwellia sp.]|nr:hypothetical protein [Colwellia sp.]